MNIELWLIVAVAAALFVVNAAMLVGFAVLLRRRLKREHLALEARLDKRLQGRIESLRKRLVTLDEHAKRRNSALIQRIDHVNERSVEELKEILESMCVLSSVLASLDLRQAKRIDNLEVRALVAERKRNE